VRRGGERLPRRDRRQSRPQARAFAGTEGKRYSPGGEAGVASSGVASGGTGGVLSGGSPLVASIGVPSLGVSYVNGSSGLLGDEDDGWDSD
jgi:hypothetical protein